MTPRVISGPLGVYTTDRAAALSGVPKRTVNQWAQVGLLVPSVCPDRVRLWSWSDLLALRAINWLRSDKDDGPRVPTRRIAIALDAIRLLGFPDPASRILLDRSGNLFFRLSDGRTVSADGKQQLAITDCLDLIRGSGQRFDLRAPKPLLRIDPGRLSGAPHVQDTRLSTEEIHFSFASLGQSIEQIHAMFPFASLEAIQEAVDFEEALVLGIAA